MNDNSIFLHIYPMNKKSDWMYLYFAENATNLKDWIARRPIHEPSFMTVFAKPGMAVTVGMTNAKGFEVTKLNTHLISDEEATALWEAAKETRETHVNFKVDLAGVQKGLFPKVERHTPFYLSPVN